MSKFIKIGEKIIDAERVAFVEPITNHRDRMMIPDDVTHEGSFADGGAFWLTAQEYADFARQALEPFANFTEEEKAATLFTHRDSAGCALDVSDVGGGLVAFATSRGEIACLGVGKVASLIGALSKWMNLP